LLRFTALVLLLLTSTARAEWIKLEPKTEQSNNSALADIISQCRPGDIYETKDLMTKAHESTHGIHSRLRNEFKRENGYYLLKGRAFLIDSPNITLRDVAKSVPKEKQKGLLYDLYLIKASQGGINGWNDTPLYVIDELIAYINGCITGLEYPNIEHAKNDTVYSYKCVLTMWEYTKIAQELSRKSGFEHQKELDEFLDFVYNKRILWLEEQLKVKNWLN
jgi:hypothetical protein